MRTSSKQMRRIVSVIWARYCTPCLMVLAVAEAGAVVDLFSGAGLYIGLPSLRECLAFAVVDWDDFLTATDFEEFDFVFLPIVFFERTTRISEDTRARVASRRNGWAREKEDPGMMRSRGVALLPPTVVFEGLWLWLLVGCGCSCQCL